MKRILCSGMLVWLAVVLFAMTPVGAFDASDVDEMGIGLGGVASYTTSWQFVDMMKYSREWRAPKGYEIKEDDLGWPVGIVKDGQVEAIAPDRAIKMYMYSRNIQGDVVLTWEGKGEVAVSRNNTPLVTDEYPAKNRRVYRFEERNRDVYDVVVKSSDPSDHVKNIRLWMPGFENAESPFHPLFKERIKPFAYFRFMDWGSTNNSEQKDWSDRKDPRNMRQTGPVAWEYMIQLCNETERDMWICIPHMATDDYVKQLATLIDKNLKPGIKVYVEYSNEIWNPGFRQTHWLWGQAKKAGHTKRPWEAGATMVGKRSAEIWKIMNDVFSDKDRLVRTMAHFRWMDRTMEGALDSANGEGKVDIIALNGYFISHNALDYTLRSLDNFDIDKAFGVFEQMVMLQDAQHWRNEMQNVKEKYGLPITCYEGGQHFANPFSNDLQGEELVKRMIEVNAHPRIKDVYRVAFESWRLAGGDGFTPFVDCGDWGKYGCWGHLRYQDQPLEPTTDPKTGESVVPAHKFKVLLDYMALRKAQKPDVNVEIDTASVPLVRLNEACSAELKATGGKAPYNWSVVGGKLPDGLRLSNEGVLSGTVKQADQMAAMLEVMDADGQYDVAILPLFVDPAETSKMTTEDFSSWGEGLAAGWSGLEEGVAKKIDNPAFTSPSGTPLMQMSRIVMFEPEAKAKNYTVEAVLAPSGNMNQHYRVGVVVNVTPPDDFLRIAIDGLGSKVSAYSRYVAGGKGELWNPKSCPLIRDEGEAPNDMSFDPGEFWTVRVTVRESSPGAIDLLISVFDQDGKSRLDGEGRNDVGNGVWIMRDVKLKNELLDGGFGILGNGTLVDRISWQMH